MKKWHFIPIIFLASCVSQLLVNILVMNTVEGFNKIGFPSTFEKAQDVAKLFQLNLERHYFTLMIFQIHSFIFLQTWCIPGTFMFNLLGGSLFGMYIGFPICLLCNCVGAYFCFCLSKFFASDLVDHYLGKQKDQLRQLLSKQNNLFFYMISLRIFPGSPNWLMNITFPHIGVKQLYFTFSIMLGLIPWNFLVCEAGVIISKFKSKDEIFQPQTYLSVQCILEQLMGLALSIALFSYLGRKKQNKIKL